VCPSASDRIGYARRPHYGALSPPARGSLLSGGAEGSRAGRVHGVFSAAENVAEQTDRVLLSPRPAAR
jgi:hypothetical protein